MDKIQRFVKALIVENDTGYREQVAQMLNEIQTVPGFAFNIEMDDITESVEYARDYEKEVALIVLDNKHGNEESYWKDLLYDLRENHPNATILLVSQFGEDYLRKDVESFEPSSKELLRTDPFITYLPKKHENLRDKVHYEHVKLFAENLLNRLSNRAALQSLLVKTAFEAAQKLMNASLSELIMEVQVSETKKDTKGLDIIAEDCIKASFVPEMHFKNVLICTEEAGLHNELYHRVPNPEFFVFSDPFDGSSAFEREAKRLLKEKGEDKSLKEVLEDGSLLSNWDRYGPISLNSPMVSMVLAERHKVVCAILINLFTSDVYVSLDNGNYYKNCKGFNQSDVDELASAIRTSKNPENWYELNFSKYDEISSTTKKLFICTLSTGKVRSGIRSSHHDHARDCIKPIIPNSYDWQESFDLRQQQNDFTPGPGRILFLTSSPASDDYNKRALGNNAYRCIMSSGEPLTEWMGWLAFLRHSTGISAFCLRKTGEGVSTCTHSRDEDPTPHIPSEINSIFRDGHIDLGILPTAYGSKMRQYTDTLVVVYDEDEEWMQQLTENGHDVFIRVPLYPVSVH
jgi:hypothetical protein